MPRSAAIDPRDAESDSVDVGIVFALAVEADAFERLVERRRLTRASRFTFSTGVVATRRVAWCVCGAGRAAAAAAASQLIDGHHPGLLITAGFAGGLDPGLQRGVAVRPAVVLLAPEGRRIALVPESTTGVSAATPLTIVTTDTIAATTTDKRALAAGTGGHLVDMETFAVAEAATAAGLPCAAVRVISDDARETLPGEVAALAAPQSSWRRVGAVINAVGRRPGAAQDLWRLWERSVVDARTLAAAVVELIAQPA